MILSSNLHDYYAKERYGKSYADLPPHQKSAIDLIVNDWHSTIDSAIQSASTK